MKILTMLILALSINVFAASAQAEPVMVSVKTSAPGLEIPPLMLGLSYETNQMMPKKNEAMEIKNGKRYFRADDKVLTTLFKTIGVKSLRIGGGSVDYAKGDPLPTEEDIVSFFDFARAAGVKVIYSFRLFDGAPASAAGNLEAAVAAAKIIRARYADVLDNFSMGNEPQYYAKTWQKYRSKWQPIRDAVVANYPEAKFSGPDEARPVAELISGLAREFGNEKGRLVEASAHFYPFGSSWHARAWPKFIDIENGLPVDSGKSREKMLSPAAHKAYEERYKVFADAIKGTSVPFRLSETNSLAGSGLWGASDSYAAALWSLDYLYWWASHGVTGVNFHTGDRSGGGIGHIARYAAFRTNYDGTQMVFPLSYGMKMFDLGGHGKLLPTAVAATADQNLVAYATLSEGKTVSVTIINKTHGPEAKEQEVKIKMDQPLDGSKAQVICLNGRDDDIGGNLTDVTLGGEPIKGDGTWSGKWTELPAVSKNEIAVKMRPASAAVVKLRLN